MSDHDHRDWLGGPYSRETVTCTDCGLVFTNRPDESGALCEECAADRDAHTDALEIRMAKVRLQPHARKEVA